MNYRNIVWASKSRAKLKKLAGNQNKALKIATNEFTDKREMMVRIKVLNIYKLNIYQNFKFFFNIKTNIAPCFFEKQFREIWHRYSTRFSKKSFVNNQLVYS